MSQAPEPAIALKSGVFFSAFDGGVVFRGGDTPVILRGKDARKLAGPIVAAMEHGVTRSALEGKVPEPIRPIVSQLLDDLEASRLLRQRLPADNTVEQDLDPQFQPLWLFLRDNLVQPGDALQRWLGTQFVIRGTLEAIEWMAAALADSAAQHLHLIPEEDEDAAATDACLERLRKRFSHAKIGVGEPDRADRGLVRILAGGKNPVAARNCPWSDSWFFGLVSGHLLVAKVDGGIAERVRDWEGRLHPPDRAVRNAEIADSRFVLAASSLAFGIFCDEMGIGDNRASGDWLFATQPELRLRPLSLPRPIRFEAPARGTSGPDGDRDDDATIEKLECLLDPITGFLDRLDDCPQVPLSIARFRVRGLAQNGADDPVVAGWGLTHQEATIAGILAGVAEFVAAQAEKAGVEGTIGVGLSPTDATGEAVRTCLQRDAGASDLSWAALSLEDINNAECWRLARLLEILVGEPVSLEFANLPEDGCAVRCSSRRYGSQMSVGAELADAAWQALGAAASAFQQSALGGSVRNAGPPLEPAGTSPAGDGGHPIDLGYPELDGVLFCHRIERIAP